MCWVCDRERIDRDVLQRRLHGRVDRSMEWKDTGLPWVMPSPNMPTPTPRWCIRVDASSRAPSSPRGGERRGRSSSGARPALDVGPLLELDLHGVTLRPVEFTPTFQKHAGRAAPACKCTSPTLGCFGPTRPIFECLQRCCHRCRRRALADRGLRVRVRSPRDRPSHRRSRVSNCGRRGRVDRRPARRGSARRGQVRRCAPRSLALREVTEARSDRVRSLRPASSTHPNDGAFGDHSDLRA